MYCPVCEMYEETPIMHSIGPLPKDAPIMEGFEGYCSIECYLEAVPNDDIIEESANFLGVPSGIAVFWTNDPL